MTSKNPVTLVEIADEPAWSGVLAGLPTSHVYSSWSWGRYKERGGWTVRRIAVSENAEAGVVGCLQLQQKQLGPLTFLLVQGGIHLKEPSDVAYYEVLSTFLQKFVVGRRLTVAVVNQQSGSSQDAGIGLLRSGFSPVLNASMYTYVLDRASGAMSGQTLSGNWRHNLKRAKKNANLSARWVSDREGRVQALQRLEAFYSGLQTRKAFAAAIDFERARDLLFEDERFHIVEAVLNGEVIATRIGVASNDHILDFLAASADAARNTYANYLLLWEMIELAERTGKQFFDCGGIQPSENLGVFNFKKGLGGRMTVDGPLWLAASGPFTRRIVRLLLAWKF